MMIHRFPLEEIQRYNDNYFKIIINSVSIVDQSTQHQTGVGDVLLIVRNPIRKAPQHRDHSLSRKQCPKRWSLRSL